MSKTDGTDTPTVPRVFMTFMTTEGLAAKGYVLEMLRLPTNEELETLKGTQIRRIAAEGMEHYASVGAAVRKLGATRSPELEPPSVGDTLILATQKSAGVYGYHIATITAVPAIATIVREPICWATTGPFEKIGTLITSKLTLVEDGNVVMNELTRRGAIVHSFDLGTLRAMWFDGVNVLSPKKGDWLMVRNPDRSRELHTFTQDLLDPHMLRGRALGVAVTTVPMGTQNFPGEFGDTGSNKPTT